MQKINSEKGFTVLGVTVIITIIVAVGAGALIWSVTSMKRAQPAPTPDPNGPQRTADLPSSMIPMNAQNNSGLNAQYQLVAVGSPNGISYQSRVVLSASNAPQGISMPAHIHSGSCANLGGVKYPLANLVNGSSTTLINASIYELMLSLPLAVNIHKSTSEPGVYVACADLNADGSLDALLNSPAR